MATPYHPVSCQWYDVLEALATKHEHVKVLYKASGGQPSLAEGRISTFFIVDKAEYLRLDNGTEIRLDCILEVNGVPPGLFC